MGRKRFNLARLVPLYHRRKLQRRIKSLEMQQLQFDIQLQILFNLMRQIEEGIQDYKKKPRIVVGG